MEASESSRTIIAEDVEITGTIKCASNIEIDGKLNGDLACNGKAVIGTTAHIKGNMTVETVTVHGQVTGNITAKDRIELKPTARMHGDIKAKRLTVEDGVTFVGKSEVNPSGAAAPRAAQPEQPASEPAAEEGARADDRQGGKGKGGGFNKK
jgi:cytoskeletal protein CcmA (bactofilin family)